MNRLSVAIITKDEERNISRCLESVTWADEIVVCDTGSSDRTVEICRERGCRVQSIDWNGFGPAKRECVRSASNRWVLSLDADEEASERLGERIRTLLDAPTADGYRIRRVSYYQGKRVRFCGWNRDYPLRLFDRQKGGFNDRIVHESVHVDGPVSVLEEPLFHHTYPTAADHYRKMRLYAALGAQHLAAEGKASGPLRALLRGGIKFLKMYLVQGGILDGRTGFLLSSRSAYGVYLKYRQLWKLSV